MYKLILKSTVEISLHLYVVFIKLFNSAVPLYQAFVNIKFPNCSSPSKCISPKLIQICFIQSAKLFVHDFFK